MALRTVGPGLLVLITLVAGCATPPAAGTAAWHERAQTFLLSLQGTDGGFAEPDAASSDYVTSLWVAMALERSGAEPSSWRPAFVAYFEAAAGPNTTSGAASFSDANQASLSVLVATALGLDAREVGGVDLVARVEAHQNASGAVGGLYNENVVGAAALASALGATQPHAAAACAWMEDQARARGWDAFSSQSWYVATTLVSLRACGRQATDLFLAEGLEALAAFRRSDGGFAASRTGDDTDASTTANAAQAFVAMGQRGGADGWQDYVAALQRFDGGVRFSAALDEPVAKTTAEALLAIGEAGWAGARS